MPTGSPVASPRRTPDYTLVLRPGAFVPSEGIAPDLQVAATGRSRHVILQFDRIPDERAIEDLEHNGIRLLDYVPNHA